MKLSERDSEQSKLRPILFGRLYFGRCPANARVQTFKTTAHRAREWPKDACPVALVVSFKSLVATVNFVQYVVTDVVTIFGTCYTIFSSQEMIFFIRWTTTNKKRARGKNPFNSLSYN